MPRRDVVVVGGSAGSVEALATALGGAPAGLPAAVFVTVHFPPWGTSRLPDVLSRAGPLPAAHARDGEPIRHGRVYVAPPNLHLLFDDGKVRLSQGPRENGVRPAIDPMFRSAARAYGARVVGVVLSGMLDDGSQGLMAVKMRGGVTVVQDPADALFPGMPSSALAAVRADHVLPAAAIGPLLGRLAVEESDERVAPMPTEPNGPSGLIQQDMQQQAADSKPDGLSAYACPECGGVMWQWRNGRTIRFHCHLGHAWSLEALLADRADELEAALWRCLRMLTEKAVMTRQVAARARESGRPDVADRVEETARLDEEHIRILRQFLEAMPNPTGQSLEVERLLHGDASPPGPRGGPDESGRTGPQSGG